MRFSFAIFFNAKRYGKNRAEAFRMHFCTLHMVREKGNVFKFLTIPRWQIRCHERPTRAHNFETIIRIHVHAQIDPAKLFVFHTQ